jgi:hypothetical protein
VSPLLRRLLGKSAADPFRVGADVDAVSGATHSSRGLALAALAGAQRIAERSLPEATAPEAALGPPEIALFALLGLALVGRNRPGLRPAGRCVSRRSS